MQSKGAENGGCACSPKLIRATIHAIVPEFCCGQTIGPCCCNHMQATLGMATTAQTVETVAAPVTEVIRPVPKVDCVTQTRETGIISADELQSLCQGLKAIGFRETDDSSVLVRESKITRFILGNGEIEDGVKRRIEDVQIEDGVNKNWNETKEWNRSYSSTSICKCVQTKCGRSHTNIESPSSMHDMAFPGDAASACSRICGGHKSIQTSKSAGGGSVRSNCACSSKNRKRKCVCNANHKQIRQQKLKIKKEKNLIKKKEREKKREKNKEKKKEKQQKKAIEKQKKRDKKRKNVCPHCKKCDSQRGCSIM